MSLGERIKEQRKKCGLSQEKVAELVGVSRQAVTKWEVGQSAPSTENLFRLAEIFGTTVDILLDSEDENSTMAEQIYHLYKIEVARKAEALKAEIEAGKKAGALKEKSKKLWLAQIILMVVAVIAAIPLTIEVFGDIRPAIVSPLAFLIFLCLLGNAICATVRAIIEKSIK